MSSLRRLSDRDLERLSAYLDGQLDPRESARLEAQLKQDPRLQQALDELHLPRQLLRSLPTLRPPRNFTLTPEMVGLRRASGAYPALRLATALATLAFLVVSGVDVLGPRLPMAAAPAAEMVSEAGADLAQTEADEALLAPAPQEVPAERGLEATQAPAEAAEPMLGAGAPAVPEPVEELQSLATGTPLPDQAAPSGGGGLDNAATPGAFGLAPTETGKLMSVATATPSPTVAPIPEAMAPAVPESLQVAPPVPPQRSLLWVEIGLGALAVALGALSLVLRRTR